MKDKRFNFRISSLYRSIIKFVTDNMENRNIEIKFRVDDIEDVEKTIQQISDVSVVIIPQEDIFFNIINGQEEGARLKLRQFKDGSGEMIYYIRPDIQGPKLSKYTKIDFDSKTCPSVREVFSKSNGILGTVSKVRHLYMIGQTRVHVDKVDGLGNFVEFEVVLKPDETIAKGEKIATELMKKLGIQENSLVSRAYMDLILQKK
ncbi:uncharacterized protein LOC106649910 [Trichogramma pretiosum]|uniref:uncharacterized protein LOC106649910 n=1 Tax=Trichogramma pretiosum TaxID=7493 RepID=UPI0006C9E5F8|nr:uncharacterized protein LOC106649910 [Trichogramma pretiosum]